MKNKIKDPFPITDVYHVSNTLVDAATVAVTDMCENLSNSYDTHVDTLDRNIRFQSYRDETWSGDDIEAVIKKEKKRKKKNETTN